MNDQRQHLPTKKGTYIMYGSLKQTIAITIGALGDASLPAGDYVYVGSAFGRGGIRARVTHHLTPSPKPHWHFDYLKAYITIQAVLWHPGTQRLECEWIHRLLDMPGVVTPLVGFGASDCRRGCPAHFLYTDLSLSVIAQHLQIHQWYEFMYNNEALPPT